MTATSEPMARDENATPSFVLWGCLAAVLLLQLDKQWTYFGHLGSVFDQSWRLYHIDFPVLEYQMEAARRFWETRGALWGYEPFYLNGFPLTFLWNSNVFLQILAVLVPWVPTGSILILAVTFCVVVEPFLVYGALANFGVAREGRCWGTLLTVLYLKLGHPVVFLVIGMLTGYLLIPLFLYVLSVMFRVASTRASPAWIAWLSLLLAFSLLLHKSFLILALPACVVIGLDLLRRLDVVRILLFCGAFAFAFAANWFWIAPAWRMRLYADFAYNSFFRDPIGIVLLDYVLLWDSVVRGFFNGTYLLMFALLGLAVAGMVQLRRSQRLLFQIIGFEVAVLAFLVARGHATPLLENLHGMRFWFGLATFLAVPAAYWLGRLFASAAEARARRARWALVVLAMLSLAGPQFESALERSIDSQGESLFQKVPLFVNDEHPMVRDANEVRAWLQENVPEGEQIFLSTYPGNHYMAGLYVGTGLRFASAPYNHIYLRHNYVNRYFQDFLRGDLDPPHMWLREASFEHGPEEFEELASFWNVRWWVVDTAGADVDLATIPGMTRVAEVGGHHIFRYGVPMSDFVVGSGRVEVDYGRIRIHDVQPHDGIVVLKMHWFEDFTVEGAERIAPHYHAGLPLALVRVENPEATVEIRF